MARMLTEECPKPTRSEQTRHKLILAALEVIGVHGYEQATTRMLTAQAGVNLAAIPYHFASKEELYRAAAEFLAAEMKADQAGPLQRLCAEVASTDDSHELIEALVRYMLALSHITLAGELEPSWIQFFLRSQADPQDAVGQVFRTALQPSRAQVRAVIARIVGSDAESLAVRSLAFSLFHQAFYLRVAEPVLLQHLARTELTAEVQQQLLLTLEQALRAQLRAQAA
ncbi:CerR family C-terminal domain-containing protein [Pelomonas sp. SE-A7]|uniref:CerR family C-terminal domain-containing protein n=1 Tax=Pelomonas sp. SE-A7 TaxID=3054953 RepID=UPI00259CBB81|nr:CerR family C-terminal domain-containing protein [Pelomonas sp. SE-A7]MDM4766463.1 CerR family C-terminal domain-containing protein [Pelomonas sp. SE-A7]